MASDFYGLLLSVALQARGSGGTFRAPFWFRDASQRLPLDRNFVSEVNIKYGLSLVPKLTVTLTPPYEDALTFLDSQLIEFGESTLEAQVGWVGTNDVLLSPVFSGLLLKPEVSLGTDISITLNAQGVGTFNVHSDGNLQELNGTREAILRTILRRDGRSMDLDVSAVRRADQRVQRAFFQDDLNISQGTHTDWQMLSQLVWEAQCWYFVESVEGRTRVKIVPRYSTFTDETAFRGWLYAFGSENGQFGYKQDGKLVLPIFSASTNSAGQYLPAEVLPAAVTNRGIDNRTRQPTTATSSAANTRVASGGPGGHHPQERPGGSNVRPTAPTAGGENALIVPGEAADSLAQSQRQSAYEEFRNRIGIQLEIETLGIPDILPGQTFAVKGLGRRIDSPAKYLVLEVEHSAGGSGFTTKLKLVSNLTFAQTERSIVSATGNHAIAEHNEGRNARDRVPMAVREEAELQAALRGL